jgi:uncharacterized protein (DUF1778 family)
MLGPSLGADWRGALSRYHQTSKRIEMISPHGKNDARLDFRLRGDLKETIERAAAELGQTVSEFAVSTLVRQAQEVLQKSEQTRLSNRDRDSFLAALDLVDVQPNASLVAAAKSYRERLG